MQNHSTQSELNYSGVKYINKFRIICLEQDVTILAILVLAMYELGFFLRYCTRFVRSESKYRLTSVGEIHEMRPRASQWNANDFWLKNMISATTSFKHFPSNWNKIIIFLYWRCKICCSTSIENPQDLIMMMGRASIIVIGLYIVGFLRPLTTEFNQVRQFISHSCPAVQASTSNCRNLPRKSWELNWYFMIC